MKENKKMALIGLVKMGTAVAEKLLETGYSLIVYNRTKNKTETLEKMGAIVADSIHPAVHVYIDKIYHRDFDQVNFDMKGGNKDIHLFQKAFLDVGVIPDLATVFESKVTEALANRMENKDWSAVSEIVRRRSGL